MWIGVFLPDLWSVIGVWMWRGVGNLILIAFRQSLCNVALGHWGHWDIGAFIMLTARNTVHGLAQGMVGEMVWGCSQSNVRHIHFMRIILPLPSILILPQSPSNLNDPGALISDSCIPMSAVQPFKCPLRRKIVSGSFWARQCVAWRHVQHEVTQNKQKHTK